MWRFPKSWGTPFVRLFIGDYISTDFPVETYKKPSKARSLGAPILIGEM